MTGVVIVGAGHAGTQAAASLREVGFDGPVSVFSAEMDAPYHRPPLSKGFIKSDDVPLQPLRGPSFFEQRGIELKLGKTVEAVDAARKRVTFENGERQSYDALGTHARQLRVPGSDLDGVVYLRSAEDARRLRCRLATACHVAVIGGGFIGLETAAVLRAKDKSVTVLEAAPCILGRAVSAEMADAIARSLEHSGVEIETGVSVDRIDGARGVVTGVDLADGRHIRADLVLVGVGAIPNADLAERAGLKVDNGICVDQCLRTSDPDIFAIGDCACFPNAQLGAALRLESVQNATDQARAVARTIAGEPTRYDALPWFWSDIGNKKLQIAGLAHGADQRVVWEDETGLRAVFHLRDDSLVAAETLNAAAVHMLSRKLIALGRTPTLGILSSGDVEAMKSTLKPMPAKQDLATNA